MTFGEKTQQLRKEKGLSQEALSEKLGVTRQTISKWELDQSTPELEYIAALSDIFEVSTDYLIKEGQQKEHKTETEKVKNPPIRDKKLAKSIPWYLLGMFLLILGGASVLVLSALSAIYPHSALVNGQTYEGLLGFLLGRNCLALFILSLCATVSGGILATWNFSKILKETMLK